MPTKPVNCLKCQIGMHRVSVNRDPRRGVLIEHWRCQQCGAHLTTQAKPNGDDPRVAKPQ